MVSTQPVAHRPRGQALRFSAAPSAVAGKRGGGVAFYAYCIGGETRAAVRRDSIDRALAAHRCAVKQGDSGYPTALILSQRIGVAFEDLARLALALEELEISDATLSRGRQAGIEAVALARELAGGHVHRMRSSSRWAMPSDALKLVSRKQSRILKEHGRD